MSTAPSPWLVRVRQVLRALGALAHDLLLRDDGRPRTPGQVWRTARAMATSFGDHASEDGATHPTEVERHARGALAAFAAAGGCARLERVARARLAAALRDQGRAEEAADAARWITRTPDAPGAGWWWMSVQYLRAGRWQQAGTAAREGLDVVVARRGPARARAELLAVLALALEDHAPADEVLAVCDEGLVACSEDRADTPFVYEVGSLAPGLLRYVRARALHALGRSEEALAPGAEARKMLPGPMQAAIALQQARVLHGLGRHAEAAATLDDDTVHAEADAALSVRVLADLAHLRLRHLGRPEEAAAHLQRACTLAEQAGLAPRPRARLLILRSDAPRAARALPAAVATAREAVDLADRAHADPPTDDEATDEPMRLARELFARSLPQASRPAPDPALRIGGRRALAEALLEAGDRSEALQVLRTARDLCRADAVVRGPEAVGGEVDAELAALTDRADGRVSSL